MKKPLVFDRDLISFTGVASILTSQILPVSAQMAQPVMHAHFLPNATNITHNQTVALPQSGSSHAHAGFHSSGSSNGNGANTSKTSNNSASTNSGSAVSTGGNSSDGSGNLGNSNGSTPSNTPAGASGSSTATSSATTSTVHNSAGNSLHLIHRAHHQVTSGSVTPNYLSNAGLISNPGSQSLSSAGAGQHLLWQNGSPNISHKSVDLDLSSASKNVSLGAQLNNLSVNIMVGTQSLAVNSSSNLTAAEKVAALQVLGTGQQSLVLDGQGTADGGSMTITPWLAQHIGNLVIPEGVVVSDVSRTGSLTVKGSLTDSGTLYVNSSNPHVSTVSVSAGNIVVDAGGKLTDVLPNASSAVANSTNLNVASAHDISNAGIISSSGALTLNAVGSINNVAQSVGAPPQGTAQPVIQASSNVI